MRYLSVCSGIEAASVAWEKLGWTPVAFSEIEPFPSEVLKHRWPGVPNLGDMTKYEDWKIGTIDLLVGGTPCQAFSVAGLRKGLSDPRGGLSLTFCKIADHFNPKWILWENVPGVLSSKDNGFGCFLGALSGEDGELRPPGGKWADAGCVYGPKRAIAWRCLDAQYFGVAQRRKRCFLVSCPRDQGDPTKVLFEWEGLRRDSAPSRGSGKEATPDVAGCLRSGGDGGVPSSRGEHLVTTEAFRMQAFGEYSDDNTASTMKARDYKDATDLVAEKKNYWEDPTSPCDTLLARDYKGVGNQDLHNGRLLVKSAIPIHDQATRHAGKRGDKQDGKGNGLGIGKEGDPAPTLTKGDKHAVLYENHPNDSRVTGPLEVAPSCVSRYGTGGGNIPLVHEAIAFEPGIAQREGNDSRFVEGKSPTLRSDMGDNQVAVAVDVYNQSVAGDLAPTLTQAAGGTNTSGPKVMAVDTYNQCLQEKAVPIRSTASDICHTGGVIDERVRFAVRRLTPIECERLQGFGDNYTQIPWRKKPADQCPDGPRYKALGNSMAVPVMRWIGQRIDAVGKLQHKELAA